VAAFLRSQRLKSNYLVRGCSGLGEIEGEVQGESDKIRSRD
jgi:hypothetical protein